MFPEHSFLLGCFKIGLKYEDLKYFTYVDILKMFLSINVNKKEKLRKANQTDIDKLLG